MGCPFYKITIVGGFCEGWKRVKRGGEGEIGQVGKKLKIFEENVWIISCDVFGNDENYLDHATLSYYPTTP